MRTPAAAGAASGGSSTTFSHVTSPQPAGGFGNVAVDLLREAAWDVSDLIADSVQASQRKPPYTPPEVWHHTT